MKEFSLIKQLNETPDESTQVLPDGVEYQQYELEVDGNPRVINIPLREAEKFEKIIKETTDPITRKTLKILLREFRGVRG